MRCEIAIRIGPHGKRQFQISLSCIIPPFIFDPEVNDHYECRPSQAEAMTVEGPNRPAGRPR